jgi:glycosyltransferase involved in cell wall biosynthesis
MRILYIGAFAGRPAEGMRSVARAIPAAVGRDHDVLCLDTREAPHPASIWKARSFAPDVIHYLAGPTVRSLGVLRAYSRAIPRAATVASAIRPFFGASGRRLIRSLSPDLVLTQDPLWEAEFRRHGVSVTFVPNGVDLQRFSPATPNERRALRARFGIDTDLPVVLHVGHLKPNRNPDVLLGLQRSGTAQAVVVASSESAIHHRVRAALLREGVRIVTGFLPDIQAIYGCADLYVFPVRTPRAGTLPAGYDQVGVIDMPLSVLEAMAADLPVLTTRFGALARVFVETASFRWFDGSIEDALRTIVELRPSAGVNRAQVEPLGWDRVGQSLTSIYAALRAAREPAAHGVLAKAVPMAEDR